MTLELSAARLRELKALAHHLDPVVIVGDAGVTPAIEREVEIALKAHELIKVRFAGDDRALREAGATALAAAAAAALVGRIGKLAILYRPRPPEPPKPPRAPAGPRRTKKQLANEVAAPRQPAARVRSARPAVPVLRKARATVRRSESRGSRTSAARRGR